jgi:hypothetical protein
VSSKHEWQELASVARTDVEEESDLHRCTCDGGLQTSCCMPAQPVPHPVGYLH